MRLSLSVRAFEVLGERSFRLLWLGLTSTSMAMNMQILARGLYVFSLTGSELDLAWVLLSFSLPQLLFALWGGVLADRLPKRAIILTCQGINTLATGFMASIILYGTADFWDFIWLGFVNGSMLAIIMPARSAFAVEIVGTDRAVNAVALGNAAWNLTRVLGPAVAGLLIAAISAGQEDLSTGVGAVYCLITGLYLFAVASTAGIRNPGRNPKTLSANTPATSPFDDLRAGLKYMTENKVIWGLLIFAVLPFMFAAPFHTLMPSMNARVLGGGPTELGLLMTSIGIGAILGSLILSSNAALRYKGYWLLGSGSAWGLLILCFSQSNQFPVALFWAALVGISSAFSISLSRAMIQLKVDDEMRGRIMSIDMMLHGLAPLGIVPLGWLAEAYGVPIALSLGGSLLLLCFVGLGYLLPEVRKIDQK